jgi:hypothetical protein
MYTIFYIDETSTRRKEHIYGDNVEVWESGVLVVLQMKRVVRFFAPGVWQRCEYDKTAQALTREQVSAQVSKEFTNGS